MKAHAIALPDYNASTSSTANDDAFDARPVDSNRRFSLQEALIDLDKGLPPAYTCSVHLSGTVLRKLENTLEPGSDKLHVPFRRTWQAVHLVLRGTILEVYKPLSGMSLEVPKAVAARTSPHQSRAPGQHPKRADSMPLTSTQGLHLQPVRQRSRSAPSVALGLTETQVDLQKLQRVQTYSLRGAIAGIASDYTKRPNVLRVRVDRDQFLIACPRGAFECVAWLDHIQKASGIAEPLESRKEPAVVWTPRRMKMRSTIQQAYELFEASQPHGALRQRTFAARVRVRPDTTGSAGTPASSSSASQEFWDRAATAHRETRQASADRPAVQARSASNISITSTRSQKGQQRHASSRRPTAHGRTSSHSQKERYVCAVLQATFPRQALVTA